ncbi:uncharacterized protein LOC141674462 [Apium graveolens]|uniref:uncharacterized protein LOC141674462 n=1 Tax=Apium graveolens TaxID=4045 RepID=UPI003D7AC000
MNAKDALYDGFRWVLGNRLYINAVKDPWLRNKVDFTVDQSIDYGVSNIPVSEFINNNDRSWDAAKVMEFFSASDASLILQTCIPHGTVQDRVAWPRSPTGVYTVKSGYQQWCDKNLGTTGVFPNKVRYKLRAKGVHLPTVCPMCDSDVEHLLYVFFGCPFAVSCWQYVGLTLDKSMVEFAPDWLLQKLNGTGHEELILIAKVLWGI